MMREQHRLRALEMRVAGHDRVAGVARDGRERLLEGGERGVLAVALGAQPEPEVERDLVVAAATGVELAADGADELGQPALDRHVDVFVAALEAERVRLELLADALEPAAQATPLGRRQELGAHQRLHVRQAALDVVRPELAIDRERAGELLDDLRGRLVEASGPCLRAGGAALLHFAPRSTMARMRSRSPFNRMKPAASACW
jgi:hypothetical protein